MPTSTQKSVAPTTAASPPPAGLFVTVFVIVAAFGALLFAVVSHDASVPGGADPKALISPIVALAALTLVILLSTAVMRNTAVFLGKASIRYYRTYGSDAPPEWIERPARAYMNLLEAPTLFYVLAILSIVTGRVDAAQIHLAWLFVAARAVHAVIYLAANHVPSRFAAFTMGIITLAVLWTRFAMMG
jgi:hypothetical protein